MPQATAELQRGVGVLLLVVSVAALALIDMVKAVDRLATVTDVRVTAKSGGRSGDWVRPA